MSTERADGAARAALSEDVFSWTWLARAQGCEFHNKGADGRRWDEDRYFAGPFVPGPGGRAWCGSVHLGAWDLLAVDPHGGYGPFNSMEIQMKAALGNAPILPVAAFGFDFKAHTLIALMKVEMGPLKFSVAISQAEPVVLVKWQ